MVSTSSQQTAVRTCGGSSRRRRYGRCRAPKAQMNTPCPRPLTQGRQEVGIAPLGQNDVWIVPVKRIHQAFHPICGLEQNHVRWLKRREPNRLHRRQVDRPQPTVVQRTVPVAVHAKHAHIVHDVRTGEGVERSGRELHPTKEFDAMGRQPGLDWVDVDREQRVVTVKPSVVDGASQSEALSWSVKRHLEHRMHGAAQRDRGFDGRAFHHAIVQPNFGLIKPHLKRTETFGNGRDVEHARSHKTPRASRPSLLADPCREHASALVVHIEQPTRLHPVPPRHLPGTEGEPTLRAGPSRAGASMGHGRGAYQPLRVVGGDEQACHRTPLAHREATNVGMAPTPATLDPHAPAMLVHFGPCLGHRIRDGGSHAGRVR